MGVTYYATAKFLIRHWSSEPDYGHGFFVPLFSLYLLWHRREIIGSAPMKWSWWALPMFALSGAIRWASIYFNLSGDQYSIFPMLIGVALFLGGWRALRWSWPAILFLVFMIPLPGTLRVMLAQPLQRVATTASVYVIQTLGMPSIAEGNTIWLPPHHLDVEQACSGIAMLMLFFAICVGAVLVLRMSLWEKCVIVASAMPIAVIANVFRVTVAGILMELVSPGAEEIFHHYVAPIGDDCGHPSLVGGVEADCLLARGAVRGARGVERFAGGGERRRRRGDVLRDRRAAPAVARFCLSEAFLFRLFRP